MPPRSGYGVVSLVGDGDGGGDGNGDDAGDGGDGGGVGDDAENGGGDGGGGATTVVRPDADGRARLTDPLGCAETRVDAYDLGQGDAVDLDPDLERFLLPVGTSGPVHLDGRFSLPPSGIARVPPSRPCTVDADRRATVVVVGVQASSADGVEPTILDLDAVEYEVPATSDVATAFLTAPLGCTGLKANARVLEPGQRVPYHTEGSQEELFVPLGAAATMRVDGAHVPTPRGTVVRVAPATPRSAVNDGDAPVRWVMFGAPPTGGPTEWDPGATIHE